MNFLIVDDQEIAVKGIKYKLEKQNHKCKICNFKDFKNSQIELTPDIIILDWKDDIDQSFEGEFIFNKLTSQGFVPTIIYSALADSISIPYEISSNPFVEIITKGDGDAALFDCINKWIPYIETVKTFKEQINSSFMESLKALGTFMNLGDKPEGSIMKYMLNKRANQFFDIDNVGDNPPAWIEYLYPPMKKHLLVADILRKISEETDLDKVGQAEEYAIILTPSCDMANGKTNKILIAQCTKKSDFSQTKLGKDQITDKNGKNKIDRVAKELNTGYNSSKVALPELPYVIPYCTVNLKLLNQVLSSEIALSKEEIHDNHKYYRVASVNSPFREQIVWAHMINSCRPGMPNRDMETWATGILTT